MKTMNKIGLCLWSGLTLLASQGASATTPAGAVPHFTLRVPLEMSKLHERIRQLEVRCSISAPRGLHAPLGPHQASARARMTVDRQTGLPSQPHIVLEFNTPAGVDPRAFTTYGCDMQLVVDGTHLVDPKTDGHGTAVDSVDSSQPYRNRVGGELRP